MPSTQSGKPSLAEASRDDPDRACQLDKEVGYAGYIGSYSQNQKRCRRWASPQTAWYKIQRDAIILLDHLFGGLLLSHLFGGSLTLMQGRNHLPRRD